jgi:predicted SAM-dependent methyltransferase
MVMSRLRRATLDPSQIRLHLGAYNCPVDGWINTDISRQILLARMPFAPAIAGRLGLITQAQTADHQRGVWRKVHYLNLARRFPFEDGTVDYIFSSHVLEHLPRPVAENFARECSRVLKPEGVARVAVPDLDLIVQQYDSENPDATVQRIFELGHNGKDRHWWMYNKRSLTDLLLSSGFATVSLMRYREGRCPDLEFLDNRPDQTLFIEASNVGLEAVG